MPVSNRQVPPQSGGGGGGGNGGDAPPTDAQLGRTTETITYDVDVNSSGKFIYKPPVKRWRYGRGDRITYRSTSGPFTIKFEAPPGTHTEMASPWATGADELRADGSGPTFVTPEVIVRYPKANTNKELLDKGKWKTPVTYNYIIAFDQTANFPDGIDNTGLDNNGDPNGKNGSVDC